MDKADEIEWKLLPDHALRLKTAREVSQWELGDPSFADVIIQAYAHPKAAREVLEEEGFYAFLHGGWAMNPPQRAPGSAAREPRHQEVP